MAAPRIILTADDFGRSPEINAAIERWARAGALMQASLMVNEPHAAAAVNIARSQSAVRVGLHLTLCDGLASDGTQLPSRPAWAGLKYAFWPGARSSLRQEITAQFRRFHELHLPPTYWDGHTHLHLHPVVMAITLPIAKKHGFRSTRLVREPGPTTMLPWIFAKLSARASSNLRAHGISFTDYVFGLRHTGRITRDDFTRALKWTNRGTVELYFHPGADPSLPDPTDIAELLQAL